MRFYDLESGARGAGAAHHTAGVSGVCCSPDASFVYSASRDKTVRIWSLPQPSMTELANIQRRAKQLQSRANGLKEYAKHMQQGKAAADGEDINAAQREFEAARSVVEKGTLEFQIADNALDRVHTAEQNKDQYVALMKSGEEATKKGDYYEARRDFESAKRIFPNRPEAKQALKRVDEAIETKSVLKTAKAKPTLEFDFSQGDRDLLEIGSNFAWLYNREEIRKASRRRSFFLFSKPDVPEAPLGLNSSPLRWTVSMTTKKGIPADNLKVRLRLQKLTGNKVIAEQDYPLSKGERNHFFVGKGGPPEGGWTAGDYHFRKFLVVKLDSDETRKGGASERIEELGSPATFSIGLINWSTKKLELKPQNIQQSAQYETSAGLTIREGDVFRFDASGKVTPATVGFYRAFWNVDVAKPKPAGPEGIPFNGRAPKRGFYRLRVENRPFAAVLYRFDSAKSPAWFSHGKGTTHGLCQSTSEVFVSINSVVATRKSRKNKFKEVPKSKHSYWLPECGSFHVKLHHGVFDFTDQLNSTAKDHLLKPFWK